MEALIPSWVGNFAGEARVTPAVPPGLSLVAAANCRIALKSCVEANELLRSLIRAGYGDLHAHGESAGHSLWCSIACQF